MGRRGSRSAGALLALVIAMGWAGAGVAAAQDDGDAQHSLRSSVTDESFYFVMADRFENGSSANDLGGLPADP